MQTPEGYSPLAHFANSENNNGREAGTEAPPPPKRSGSKARGKRTKTGCLTCRKRRIKCGEERPGCKNCSKSKRPCEGYYKQVVFKDPINTYRPPASIQPSSLQNSSSSTRYGERSQQSDARGSSRALPSSASGSLGIPMTAVDRASSSKAPLATSPEIEYGMYSFPQAKASTSKTQASTLPSKEHRSVSHDVDSFDRSHIPEPRNRTSPPSQPAHYDFDALVKQERQEVPSTTPTRLSPLEGSRSSHSSTLQPYFQGGVFETAKQLPANVPHPQNYPTTSSRESAEAISASLNNSFRSLNPSGITANRSLENADNIHTQSSQIPPEYQQSSQKMRDETQSSEESGRRAAQQYAPFQYSFQRDDRRDDQMDEDDDPYDVLDDDEDTGDIYDHNPGHWHDYHNTHLRDNDLGILVALQARQDTHNIDLRSITSFINCPDMLSTYTPSFRASPLQDPMTARIFCHFVNVTGPCISMFERHPANPSLIFQGSPVPRSQQNIWTYTFPTLALQNTALLHAMLAVASLHIAKIQDQPITAALKHYAICLRRIGKSVSLASRRKHPATLAAAMLLAFFECWSADHQKWINHLLGAKQLFKEIDFEEITRYAKRMRRKKRSEDHAKYYQALQLGVTRPVEGPAHFQLPSEVDENIVGTIMGRRVPYDKYGQITEDGIPDATWNKTFSEKDLETYETQRDLFWWYCKQDAYQGILGGGKLFMDYSLWSHCPPRAPLGCLNATYGTYDHLILLLGRLADFAARDVNRKQRAMKANGGIWRPPESMRSGPPPPTHPDAPPSHPAPPMPAFNGMVPDVKPAQLPMGFSPERDPSTPQSPSSSSSSATTLESQTAAAEEEWTSIRTAFSLLESRFGPDLQALGPEFSGVIETPFGNASQYRTYGIAGIWMNYYMGLIACHRAHPCMPPAAMMAAGIAARQTANLANEIGRIAAGIAPDLRYVREVSPSVGAALIESSTCMFIAGVQYQDRDMRWWTARRLRDIARLTGWQTSYAICMGCETAWRKAAELGRGPVYVSEEQEQEGPGGGNGKGIPDMAAYSEGRRVDRVREVDGRSRVEILEGSDRVHFALGVLSIQEDFEGLELEGENREMR